MKINFTNKEYATLIEMLDIASWVISAYKNVDGPREKPYDDLRKKLYALASDFGCDDKITYSKEDDDYFETRYFEMESPHREFIEEYDNEVFWSQLIDRLATRDAINEVGEDAFSNGSIENRFAILGKHEEIWSAEFEKNSLDNLAIKSGKPLTLVQ